MTRRDILAAFLQSPAKRVATPRLHKLRSHIFQNQRIIRVWLPASYNATQRYAALYLNDGQTLESWRVAEAPSRLEREKKIAPLIVIGIDSAGQSQSRAREYLPFHDETLRPPVRRPMGALYPEFFEREVMPLVEGEYPIAGDQRGIGGSSYGALIALYTALRRPRLFQRLLLESPSLYVSKAKLLGEIGKLGKWPGRIYAGTGTAEAARADWSAEAVRNVETLAANLRSAGFANDRLRTNIERDARHDTAAWARRLPAALSFLYSYRSASTGTMRVAFRAG